MIRSVNGLQSQCWHSHSSFLNLTQKRYSFYNKYKHGPTKISNPTPDYLDIIRRFFSREGIEFVKGEINREVRKPFRIQKSRLKTPNETYIFEDFDTDESVKRWKPVADSDSLHGFSVASIMRSPAGHGLFKGVLDNRVPDDGLTMKSGFVGLIGPTKPRDHLLSVEEVWDWQDFNCLEIRFRGDGRKYNFVVNIGTYKDDLRHYDHFSYPLYTRGGPYWQTYRIPFSKFLFCFKGFIQDDQAALPVETIKFVALTLQDGIDGPFNLEVDYIGLRNDTLPFLEACAYELYSHPHIRYRQLQVDCPPPDDA